MATDAEEIFPQIERWRGQGQRVALATVVQTWGSSPRAEGSHLAVNERGEFVGSVSGGCIEGAVVTEALAVMTDGKPRTLEFGISDEQAWEVGLACGGRVRVYADNELLGTATVNEHGVVEPERLVSNMQTDGKEC